MTFETTPGDELARQRAAAGVTIAELARSIGVSRPTVYAWEQAESVGELQARRYLDGLHRIVDRFPDRRPVL